MKNLLLILALLFVGSLSAQDINNDIPKKVISSNENRKATRNERFNAIAKLIESKAFVLEATILEEDGHRHDVSGLLNFVMVDSSQSIIQKGNDASTNINGFEGRTTKGSILDWKLNKDEKRNLITLKLTVLSYNGNCEVFINVNDSGDANAIVSGEVFHLMTLKGKLLALDESNVHVERHL